MYWDKPIINIIMLIAGITIIGGSLAVKKNMDMEKGIEAAEKERRATPVFVGSPLPPRP